MSTDIDFSKRTEVELWLADKPREVAVVLSARAALRAAPLLVDVVGPLLGGGAAHVGETIVLSVFRAMAAPWVAGQYPTHEAEVARAAARAADDADATTTQVADASTNAAYAAAYAANAAYAAAYAANAGNADAPDTARAADAASTTFAARAADAAYPTDAQIIDQGVSASALAARPLWLTVIPAWPLDGWQRLEQALLRENQDWRVWTEWYHARLEGRRSNEALEVARALIAEEIWKQGPRAVNAEIARLIAEHAPAPETSAPPPEKPPDVPPQRAAAVHAPAPETSAPPPKKPPDVPTQRAAAVEPVWHDYRLTLPSEPASQDLKEAEFVSALAGLRDELREFAEDLSGEANIDGRFLSFVRRFADRIPQALPTQDELFRLGHVEEVFVAYAKTVESEWPDFLSVRYHALMLQCERTMRQSALWRSFKYNAEGQTLTAEQIVAATPLATAAANALREAEAPAFVDAAVPAALHELTQTLQQLPGHAETPLDAIEAGTELLAADLIESVNNVLKPIAEAALTAAVVAGKALGEAGKTLAEAGQDYAVGVGKGLREAAKKEGPKDGERAFKWLRRLAIAGAAGAGAAGTGVFAELSQLIAKFPHAFEWLARVLHFIK